MADFRRKEICRVVGFSIARGLAFEQETIVDTTFPNVFSIALSAGTLVTKFTVVNLGPLFQELHPVVRWNFLWIVGFEGAPYGKEDSSLGGPIDLNAEIALGEARGHEVAADYILALWNPNLRVNKSF